MRKKVILIVVIAISSIGCHSNIESGYDIYEEEAFIAFIGGDYEKSLKLLHELRENRRGEEGFMIMTSFYLGEILLLENRKEEAKSYFQKIVSLESNFLLEGLHYIKTGIDIDEYSSIIRTSNLRLARILNEEGQYGKSLKCLERVEKGLNNFLCISTVLDEIKESTDLLYSNYLRLGDLAGLIRVKGFDIFLEKDEKVLKKIKEASYKKYQISLRGAKLRRALDNIKTENHELLDTEEGILSYSYHCTFLGQPMVLNDSKLDKYIKEITSGKLSRLDFSEIPTEKMGGVISDLIMNSPFYRYVLI